MRIIMSASVLLLFTLSSCGSGDSKSTAGEDSTAIMPGKGNSGGSDITGMDTARMDTSMQTTPAKH